MALSSNNPHRRLNYLAVAQVTGCLEEPNLSLLGARLLVEGFDSTSLRDLAGDENNASTFHAALRELGADPASSREAVLDFASTICERIIEGSVLPEDGARLLTKAARLVPREFHDLDPFIYADSEMDDRPLDREFFRKAILEEAIRLAQARIR